MKKFMMCFLFLSHMAMASNAVVIKSDDANSEVARLPQDLLSVFVDNGIKQIEVAPKVYDLTVNNLRCDLLRRDVLFPDYSNAGLSSVKCFINAEVEIGGAGTLIQDGRFLVSLLNVVEANRDISINDCAMGGRCVAFVSKIKCTVDLNKDYLYQAFSCELE